MTLIIGNTIALIGSILLVYVGLLKEKKKILYIQTIQIGMFVVSDLILGGITGAIINVISMIRNILCYKEKLGLAEKIIITILSVSLSIVFNNMGLIGLFPLISTVLYVWLINTKNIKYFKLLIAFTMLLWFIYDICIESYTSAVFDLISVIANIVTLFQIKSKTGDNNE